MPDAIAEPRLMTAYLEQLRTALTSLPAEQRSDIVEEIRSHIRDAAAVSGELKPDRLRAALDGLGQPGELAARYITQHLVERAQRTRSPWLILKSAFRWAGLSVAGFFVFMGSVLGYGLAFSFSLCALLKPFHPASVGLWRTGADEYSLHLGFQNPPSSGTELLGWWMIPIGLVIGYGLFYLTVRFGLWSIGKFWRNRRAL